METTFLIKQKLKNYENFKVLCLARKSSKLFEISYTNAKTSINQD